MNDETKTSVDINKEPDRGGLSGLKRPEVGKVYEGRVLEYSPLRQMCEVQLIDYTSPVVCHITSNIMSGLFGFRDWYKPEPGIGCLVLYTASSSYIIRYFDADPPDTETGSERQAGALPQALDWDKIYRDVDVGKGIGYGGGGYSTPFSDMVEGEYDITNMLGVGMQFLTTIMRMTAGDRAVVETHLMNDMVRILSGHFKHIHALGKTEIYEDGGLHMSFDGTPYPWEVTGADKPDEKLHNIEKDKHKPSDEDRYKEKIKSRISMWVGWVGDMVNLFITEPGEVMGALGRSGRSRMHVGQDGSVLVQSIAEIAFERVVRISVPIKKNKPGDPSVDPAYVKDQWDEEAYKWSGPSDALSAPESIFKIRQTSRILNQYLTNYRAENHPDYATFTEAETSAPSWQYQAKNKDDEGYLERYSTMRILRDGSILLFDAYGSAIATHNGNATVSCPKHLMFEAGGDIRMLSGNKIILAARDSIELASDVGGIRMKARAWLEGLCSAGAVWFKSDAPREPQDSLEDAPDPIDRGHGIILESTQHSAVLRGAYGTTIETTAPDEGNNEGRILIQARAGKVEIRSVKDLLLVGRHMLWKTSGDIITTANRFLSNFQLFTIGERFAIRSGGRVHAQSITSGMVTAHNTIRGPDFSGAPTTTPFGAVFIPHENHIQKLTGNESEDLLLFGDGDNDTDATFNDNSGTDAVSALRSMDTGYQNVIDARATFRMMDNSDYIWGGPLYQSLSQQTIALESAQFSTRRRIRDRLK